MKEKTVLDLNRPITCRLDIDISAGNPRQSNEEKGDYGSQLKGLSDVVVNPGMKCFGLRYICLFFRAGGSVLGPGFFCS